MLWSSTHLLCVVFISNSCYPSNSLYDGQCFSVSNPQVCPVVAPCVCGGGLQLWNCAVSHCVNNCTHLVLCNAGSTDHLRTHDTHLNCWSNITSQQKQGSKMKKVKAIMQVFSIVDPHPMLCM